VSFALENVNNKMGIGKLQAVDCGSQLFEFITGQDGYNYQRPSFSQVDWRHASISMRNLQNAMYRLWDMQNATISTGSSRGNFVKKNMPHPNFSIFSNEINFDFSR